MVLDGLVAVLLVVLISSRSLGVVELVERLSLEQRARVGLLCDKYIDI